MEIVKKNVNKNKFFNCDKMKRALFSVSNKNGIGNLAKFLAGKHKFEIVSTSSTFSHLQNETKHKITSVDQVTDFPEMLDGRVKTLHPKIHGALLGNRKNLKHKFEMETHQIVPFDVVAVNLYPFQKIIEKNLDASEDEITEMIDIGGHSIIRAAAKNGKQIAILTSPEQYCWFIDNFENFTEEHYKQLRQEAWKHIAEYDCAIRDHYSPKHETNVVTKKFRHFIDLKYGNNGVFKCFKVVVAQKFSNL